MTRHVAIRNSKLSAVAVLFANLTLVGCDSGPRMAPVHGIVTVKGKPISEGDIMFYPSSGRPAMGQIGEDGSYSLTTTTPGDGAQIGEYVVTIEAVEVTEAAPPPTSLEEEIEMGRQGRAPTEATVRWLVPEEFADRTTTPLKATVKDGDNKLDFEIP